MEGKRERESYTCSVSSSTWFSLALELLYIYTGLYLISSSYIDVSQNPAMLYVSQNPAMRFFQQRNWFSLEESKPAPNIIMATAHAGGKCMESLN